MGHAVARNSGGERKWVKDSQHFAAELRDFRVVVEANSHQFHGSVASLGTPSPGRSPPGPCPPWSPWSRSSWSCLDAGVPELLLDDFQVGAAGLIQVRRTGMATRVRGVPGIQAHTAAMRRLTTRQTPLRVRGPRLPLATVPPGK